MLSIEPMLLIEPLIEFDVYGKPEPRGSKKATPVFNRHTGKFVTTTGGRPIVNVRDDNDKSKAWMQRVAQVAGEIMADHGLPLYEGPLGLSCFFRLVRPKGHYGKRGLLPSAPQHHLGKPDVTKMFRGVEDALKGVVWRDDSQIVRQEAGKDYGETAGVTVKIWRV